MLALDSLVDIVRTYHPAADLDLIRKWGVQIAGIRQGPRQNLSPTGRDHFLGGDELLILGTHAQIRGFSEAIAACTGAPDTIAKA